METDTNLTASAGDRVVLVCRVENLGTREIIWRKLPSVTPLTIGGYVYVNDVTISVEHARESEDWKLIISGAHSRHSGEYECQVPTADKQMRKQFYLTVTEKSDRFPHQSHSKEVIYISDRQHVNTDEPFEISCNATGDDFVPDNIDWFKNGQKLQSDVEKGVSIKFSVSMETKTIKSTFRVAHANMTDAGTYTCRTSNSLVESTSVVVLYATSKNSKRVIYPEQVHSPSSWANHLHSSPSCHLFISIIIVLLHMV